MQRKISDLEVKRPALHNEDVLTNAQAHQMHGHPREDCQVRQGLDESDVSVRQLFLQRPMLFPKA